MKKQNIACESSIAFLSHPFAITALIVLLLNDHLFRKVWPSWMFGKLGDLAWLFVFPAFLVIPLSILIPNRTQLQARRVGFTAYAVTAVVFACANLSSPVHGIIVQFLENLLGTPIGLVRDPTDLFALFALVYSWSRWKQSQLNEALAWRGISAISIVVLLSLANGPGPDIGIACLELQDDVLVAQSGYFRYSSRDGGTTWTLEEDGSIRGCDANVGIECNVESLQTLKVPLRDGEVIYRFQPCGSIELSNDGGVSWRVIKPYERFSDAERVFYEKERSGWPRSWQGPFDVVFDDNSGNVIFAMGHQGVLLLDEDGNWKTVSVGSYVPYSSIDFSTRLLFISGEGGLSIFAGLLLINLMSLDIRRDRRSTILLVIACALFLINALILRPAYINSYVAAIGSVMYISCGIFLALVTIERIVILLRSYRLSIAFMIKLAALSVLLYFLPFMLWLMNAIPNYHLALGFSLASTLLLYFSWKRKIKEDPAFIKEHAPVD